MNAPDKRLTYLKQHITDAADKLSSSTNDEDGLGSLIYLGNHHDSVPRELIADPHLESGEIHTWMLMKIQVSNPAIPTSIPSQDKLLAYLKCSRPVLSRHLQVLRALRWITLCKEVRGHNGQYKGYVYAQHDKPLNLADTLFLDPTYISFLETENKVDSLKRLRLIKSAVLMHMDYQVVTDTAFEAPGILESAAQHLDPFNDKSNSIGTLRACPDDILKPSISYDEKENISKIDDGPENEANRASLYVDHVNNLYTVEKENPGHVNILYMDETPLQRDVDHVKDIYMDEKGQKLDHVNVYTADTVCSSNILNKKTKTYIKTTTTKQKQLGNLRFPRVLDEDPRLKLFASKVIDSLPLKDQQYALDYLSDRLKAAKNGTCDAIDNIIGYLNWIVKNIHTNTLPPCDFGVRKQHLHSAPTQQGKSQQDQEETQAEASRRFAEGMKRMGVEIDPVTKLPKRNNSLGVATRNT